MTAVTDAMLDVFEAAEAAHTFTHGGDYRRCCYRAGLEAVAPHIAVAQMAADAAAIRAEVNDLKAEDYTIPSTWVYLVIDPHGRPVRSFPRDRAYEYAANTGGVVARLPVVTNNRDNAQPPTT